MTKDEQFFYDNAGYSYGKGETREQGRMRCARSLAEAEVYAWDHDWVFSWEYDDNGCSGCDCGSPDCPCASGAEHETLGCILFNREQRAHGNVIPPQIALASLWGICEPTTEYRRVVEAELASEALYNLRSLALVCAE